MNNLNSEAFFNRAQKVIPGGVSSPVRAFKSVGGIPRYVAKAIGSTVSDVDGNNYVDLVGAWGPMILGHAHPAVVDAVRSVAEKSFSYGAPCAPEVELAEEIVKRVGPVERVRFTNSGTEAVMTAIRIARAKTGRNTIVKFAGCYHGHADAMLVAAGSGAITLSMPDSQGIPQSVADDTLVIPYGDVSALQEIFSAKGHLIAAVITEAAPANMGVVVPPAGFNALISQLTKTYGALFILDEVMTGFRVSVAGWWGLDGKNENWAADLFTFGKVIGGGMPLAAVAGSAECLDLLSPLGSVYQAGTLSGNPIATTAGLTTLQHCTTETYETLNKNAQEVGSIVSRSLFAAGVSHQLQTAGNLFSVFFTENPVLNFAQAKLQNANAYATFFHEMLAAGVWLPPSAFESWFVSCALTHDDFEIIEKASKQAANAVASTLPE